MVDDIIPFLFTYVNIQLSRTIFILLQFGYKVDDALLQKILISVTFRLHSGYDIQGLA